MHSIILSIDFTIIDSYDANQQYDMEFNTIKKLSDKKNPELMWRLARAYFNQAEKESNEDKKNKLFYISYDYSKQSLYLDSTIAKSNHYYAVLHGQIGLIEGTKQKIINAYDVLKYGKIAINLDPSYDNTYHLLGRLNFELVQKALMSNVGVLIGVGAPTSLAIDLANKFDMTLVGFVKQDSFNIYSNKERIIIRS